MFQPFSLVKPHNPYVPALLSLVTMLISYNPALAQVDANTIEELRAEIAALSERLQQLEQLEEAGRSEEPAEGWFETVNITGDLRPRFEYIDDETATDTRNRSRIRARLDISADINNDWNGSIGLASGGDDPISSNQTLGNGGSTKDIRLDYAYFEYSGLDNFVISGGKYKNVFFRPGEQAMIFDGDYRPEGLAVEYTANSLFMNAGTMILESDQGSSGTGDTASMWGIQLGYRMNDLTIGASYFNTPVKGSNPFYHSKPYGNSVDANNSFIYDYKELELFAEYSISLGRRDLDFFGDYVRNLDADQQDTGWLLGVALVDELWEAGYSYQNLEADAVFGAFTDSDFGGGGTDAKGHILTGTLSISDAANVGFTYFINKRGRLESDYDRFQFDLSVSF